jgi:ATP-dependent DNA helicase RecQ
MTNQAERLAWLAEQVPALPGSGIVYCLTIADTERVAGWLISRGIDARAYNADLPTADREALEDALVAGDVKALVATVALGMGFDKPDLGWVVHYQRPGSAIAYYQQVGRAGRAVDRADGILLSGREDDEIADWFIRNAFPPTVNMEEILDALSGLESATVPQLERAVNLPRGRIDQALKLLEIDGAVSRDRGRFSRTGVAWAQDEERIARVIATRRKELADMRAYVTTTGCRMEYLIRLLDDPVAGPCGRCDNCRGQGLARSAAAELVREAVTFLRRDLRSIEPRKMWAADAVAGLSGKVAPPNEPGVALSVYGDAGWGRLVEEAREGDRALEPDIVAGAALAVRDRWRPEPAPEWVTAVPSATRPALVPDFARTLAAELGLPFVPALVATPGGEPQVEMRNSVQQLRNAHAKLAVDGATVLPGPVLLVDDLIDSGWTMTVAGSLLRDHASGPVHPFALATATR